MLTAEYGGTGGKPIESGMVVEEPDIEIGAGVSSKGDFLTQAPVLQLLTNVQPSADGWSLTRRVIKARAPNVTDKATILGLGIVNLNDRPVIKTPSALPLLYLALASNFRRCQMACRCSQGPLRCLPTSLHHPVLADHLSLQIELLYSLRSSSRS